MEMVEQIVLLQLESEMVGLSMGAFAMYGV